MMGSPVFSRFTPSIMAPEVLEAVFVQRESLAERLVDLIEDSARTGSKHHTLLIGPRGIGKTHMVSLVYHRIRASEVVIQNKLLLAWLREEEWGVMSFLDLLLRIHRALIAEYNDKALEAKIEELFEMDAAAAERRASQLLIEFVGNRTLFIIIENLDDLFGGLEEEGQMRLRSFLQENPLFTILAASQSLFGGVSLQTSPFYGFFRIVHLDELSIDDATKLVKKIAELNGDKDLAEIVETPIGHARIKVLHRLAGGNHRVYIIFSEFLTRESFNELIDAMMRTLDELTPYYQERIRWLSPQQRKIVEMMCDRGSALSVKEIASRTFMTHQTASGQLKQLRELGYVKSNPIGRESYYELREPLMRLCIEVKKHRDRPIRLIVDLLRSWYTTEELQKRLGILPDKDPRGVHSEREHIKAALEKYQSAEILFSLSNAEKLREAILSLITTDTRENESNVIIVTEAVWKMSRMVTRMSFTQDRFSDSYEYIAQNALLKFFQIIKNEPKRIQPDNNPVGYLYAIVRNIARNVRKKEMRQVPISAIPLNEDGKSFDEEMENLKSIDNWLLHQPEISPDYLLELRALLLQKTQSYLLKDYSDNRKLRRRLKTLAIELKEAEATDVLSESIIRCTLFLTVKENGEYEVQRLRKWSKLLSEELRKYYEFEIALRIVDKIIRFSETRDRRILLELRPEERTFLEPLIKEEL